MTKLRIAIIPLVAFILLACSLGLNAANSTPVQVPPTPSQGGTSIPVNTDLPDLRIGNSGNSCSSVAADLSSQHVTGTLTVFPNAAPNQLRAVTNDGKYSANAALLNGNCQSTGQQYGLTATFGLDYMATVGNSGSDRCVSQSRLVVTSFSLQGLPGPIADLAQGFVQGEIPGLLTPRLDQLVVRYLNHGRVPASGARCPGS